jgi:hypothetical protein
MVDAAHKLICLNLSWNFYFLQSIIGKTRNKNGEARQCLSHLKSMLLLMIGCGIAEAV